MKHHNSNQIQSLFGQNISSASVQAFLRFGVQPQPLLTWDLLSTLTKTKTYFWQEATVALFSVPEIKENNG